MPFKPAYLDLLDSGKFKEVVARFDTHRHQCQLCPHNCRVDRHVERGVCDAPAQVRIASFGPHFGEESVLVGRRGSGTIFFSHCNMRCVYCQNYTISYKGEGKLISDAHLADIMLTLQNFYQCHNINLVSPTHYLSNIVTAIYLAAQNGLKIPIVYNTGGYENIDVLKDLEGIVDIYMPDFKYIDNETAYVYSNVMNYGDVIQDVLLEMQRQVGVLKTKRKLAYRGLLIRHLLLPHETEATRAILDFILTHIPEKTHVNLKPQYLPAHRAFDYEPLRHRIKRQDHQDMVVYGRQLGLTII